MEVSESEWMMKAIENVDRYRNRGGPNKGNDPQMLGETELQNTIGVAMGFPVQSSFKWTTDELEKASNNKLVFFDGTALEAINVIRNQIIDCCGGYLYNYVTVLPIELYYQGKLYELPLFRVHHTQSSTKKYVDNIGRVYSSVSDWHDHNKLPPCKMAYPYGLDLKLAPGYDHSHLVITDTPSARPEQKVVEAIDVVTAVVGIGSSLTLLFVTGGLAAPLVAAGVGSATWGTIRAGYQLIDKDSHGENVNPFTNAESRMLWLGIAANVLSFGAIGASMRLTSLAARGHTISNAFRVFVNVTNGTSIAVSGAAIIDTAVYLYDNYNDLSFPNVLMLVASIAFWTKGAYNYKTAGTIIREAQAMAFSKISSNLNKQQVAELTAFRDQFQSDPQLLREYHRAARSGISENLFSQILLDGHRNGPIQFDNKGNMILGGHSFSFEFLSSLQPNVRSQCFSVIQNFNSEQSELFKSFRRFVNNDYYLISRIHRIALFYGVDVREITTQLLSFWRTYSQMNLPGGGSDIKMTNGNLVIGRAPPIRITELSQWSPPMVKFVGEHLSRIDATITEQWSASSVPVLMNLERYGMVRVCPVTKIIPTGRAVVLLNDQLKASIHTLNVIVAEDCQKIFDLISRLPSRTLPNFKITPDLLKLCNKHRLRLEWQRTKSVEWMTECVKNHSTLRSVVTAELQSFEQDRLFTFNSSVDVFKAAPYMTEMMAFVVRMNPRNISEMVAYGEFVIAYVETQKLLIKEQLMNGTLELPRNVKKTDWLRTKATELAFEGRNNVIQKFNEMLAIVTYNKMVGVETVSRNLSDTDLVAAIREKTIKFASRTSAAYHIYKHPTDPYDVYITRANETIRSSSDRYSVTLTQDGDARTIRFENEHGSSIVLERDGGVLLCTFTPKKSK